MLYFVLSCISGPSQFVSYTQEFNVYPALSYTQECNVYPALAHTNVLAAPRSLRYIVDMVMYQWIDILKQY